MKLNQGKGSMGIPEEIRVAGERAKEQANQKVESDFGFAKNLPPQEDPKDEPKAEPKDEFGVEDLSPLKMLERIGVKFTEEDFTGILFKGIFTTNIDIVKTPKFAFTATMKTLTGTEYDMVDELIAAEAETIKMTNDGFANRKAMWVIAVGVTQLQGKQIVKADPKKELKDIAAEKRKVLSELSPAVLNRLIQLHGTITTAINLIVSKPDDHLKNL